MTKIDILEFLLFLGPGILAFVVYGWFLRRFLFRKPDVRTLEVRIRRRLFLAAAFWPFAASISGTMILLALCIPEIKIITSFLFALVLSYAVGMLLFLPWYPRLPFLGRARDLSNRKTLVSLFRFSLLGAIIVALVAWTVVGMGVCGGRLECHLMEDGPRSIENRLPKFCHGEGPAGPAVWWVYPSFPSHSCCILCRLERCLKHIEMRLEWRSVPIKHGGNEMNEALKAQPIHGGEFKGGK